MAIKTYRTQDAQWRTGSAAEAKAASVAGASAVVLRAETQSAASSDDRPPIRSAAAPAATGWPVSPNTEDDENERPHPIVVALAALAGFAFTATVASLIAIFA